MELHQKLQELRRRKGITQEELAAALYVSRTAVSKWESGRGYPTVDSLKAIASYYSVSLDSLLSADEALSLAEADNKQKTRGICDVVFGLLDLGMLLLLVLPLFAARDVGDVQSVSLLALTGVQSYLKVLFFVAVVAGGCLGVLLLALQNSAFSLWVRCKSKVSLAFSALSALLFILSLQPYAAVFALALLSVKALLLAKRL
ncbi:MAG: helix-turn-helix transcriptional regulator [Clostridia bacterium]|nr:helix-turn-helix transcriptional regulator [Clostridia bacterium]